MIKGHILSIEYLHHKEGFTPINLGTGNKHSVLELIHAFENNDLETAYSFYDEKARFSNINMPIGESQNLEEAKAGDKKFFEKLPRKKTVSE